MDAILLVSGGAAVTPFTTPDMAAAEGLAAGNTMTALRAHLLAEGNTVFTAPATIGSGTADRDGGWQGFDGARDVLPPEVTINAVGTIEEAGRSLSAFIALLRLRYGVTRLDIVGHSMGGLFSRAAIAALQRAERGTAGAVRVRRLVTLGTPWTGSLLGDYRSGDIALADAHGDPDTEAILQRAAEFADVQSQGAAEDAAARYLTGADGWNARQAGVLDDVDVSLVAGDWFHAADEPDILWPHDGLVQTRSASALDVDPAVLPRRALAVFDDVHSIFFADAFGLPWERALTWDPRVLEFVSRAVV